MCAGVFKEAILSTHEFVGDERGHEIDGGQFLARRLPEARFEDRGHARQPQLPVALGTQRPLT